MGGAMMEYTVLRSRRRTMALQVTREAQVVVRAPLHAAEADIRRFVQADEDWLSRQLARQREWLSAHPPRSPESRRRCGSRPRRSCRTWCATGRRKWASRPRD